MHFTTNSQHLSNVEDHIRRLQERCVRCRRPPRTRRLEKEHYDDRAQAEREAERLNQLIDESKKTIATLQEAATRRRRRTQSCRTRGQMARTGGRCTSSA